MDQSCRLYVHILCTWKQDLEGKGQLRELGVELTHKAGKE